MPTPDEQQLKLSDLTPFGVGGRRLCFVHPHDPSKCVKVLRTDERRTVRTRKSPFIPAALRRVYDNNADELRELLAIEKRIGRNAMSHNLPLQHGMIDTDLGPGLVLDLIRDLDGGIARSVRELITNGLPLTEIKPAFNDLGAFLLSHRIVTRQILDHNIAARHIGKGQWRFFIIDGLGDPAFLSFINRIPPLARKRIARNLDRAWNRFDRFAQTGGVTEEMIRKSTWGQGMLNHRGT